MAAQGTQLQIVHEPAPEGGDARGGCLGRLRRHGVQALDDGELLALLFQGPESEALRAGRGLLASLGSLLHLLSASDAELQGSGLAERQLASLLAARELAARMARARIEDRPLLDQPSSVAGYLVSRYLDPHQEVMGALFLDVRNHLLGEEVLFRGTPWRTAVHPSVPLRKALLLGAHAFLLFHNHPSGDPAPSQQDLRFTRRVSDAAELVGIRLIDHLILAAPGSWISLRRRGSW